MASILQKYKDLFTQKLAQSGIGQMGAGLYSRYHPYLQNVSSAANTLSAELYNKIGSSKPLLGTGIGNKYINAANQLSQRAYDTRKQRGTLGSVDQGFVPAASTAIKGLGSTAEAMLTTYGLSNPATALTGASLAGGLTYVGGKVNKRFFGGEDATPQEIAYAMGRSPYYSGIARFFNPYEEKIASKIAPNAANWLTKGTMTGTVYGAANALEDEALVRIVEQRVPSNTERMTSFGMGMIFGIGGQAVSVIKKFFKNKGATDAQAEIKVKAVIWDETVNRFRKQGKFSNNPKPAPQWVRDAQISDDDIKAIRKELGLPEKNPIGFQVRPTSDILEADRIVKSSQGKLNDVKGFNEWLNKYDNSGYGIYRNPGADEWRAKYIKPLQHEAYTKDVSFSSNPIQMEHSLDDKLVGKYTKTQLDNMSVKQKMTEVLGKDFTNTYNDMLKNPLTDYVYKFYQTNLSQQPLSTPKVNEKPGLQPVGDILESKIPQKRSFDTQPQGQSLVGSKTSLASREPTVPAGGQSSPKSISQGDKYAFSVNKNKLNISDEAKVELDKITKDIKPELEEVKGKKMTNEEVLQAAGESQILRKVISREDTLKATAAITKLRQVVAAGAEEKGLTKDFIENLKTLNSVSSDAGRRLKAFDITADPISSTGIKEELISRLLKTGAKNKDIIKASEGVDWNNPKQVTDFYRKFVKPSIGDIINEYRYINLLSSPKTHIVNAFSNALQAMVVSPTTKLYSGVIDFFGSSIIGKQRQHYINEVPAYYKGLFNSIGDAYLKAKQALKGKTFTERPDVGRLPTNVKFLKHGQIVPRALEAGDVFFRTMIAAGEKEALLAKYAKQGKEVSEAVINKRSMDKAQELVFRKALDPNNKSGQGALLSYIDKFTTAVYGLRKVPGVSWFIPFVQTPMNILKQGIEYSPAGIATLPGSKDKTEQLAKALVGSTVMAGAAYAAQMGDSTWAAPVGERDKEAFYASGRQPYSIKIGDQWVSYSRLGPLAYPIAMAAAIKYYTQQDPRAVTKTKLEQTSNALAGLAKFFTDQSYMQGIGDIVDTFRGDKTAAKQTLSNIPRQLVPLSSLTGWIARIMDPIYRHPSSTVESIKTGIPVLSKTVAPYTNPAGIPSERQNLLFNALSPINVTPNNQGYSNFLNLRENNKRYDLIKKQIKDLRDSGDMEGAMKVLRDNRDIIQKGAIPNKIVAKTDELQQKRNKIMNSNLPEDQKKRLLLMIEKQLTSY